MRFPYKKLRKKGILVMVYNRKILIVEDDEQIRNFMCYTLKNEGFQMLEADTGEKGVVLAEKEKADMLLLDLGLPGMDGMEVLKRIRKRSEIPVIIISARDQDEEKAEALDMGADDYLTKPFSATELMARIRVGFRHYYRACRMNDSIVYEIGGLSVDLSSHLVMLEGREIHLTPMEYELLVLFMKNAGKVLTKRFLLEEIYGNNCGADTQALRSLMAGLRRKIEENPAQPVYIITETGIGYRIKTD